MKKLRNLILIMICITLTVTKIPNEEYHTITPHGHHETITEK